MRLALCSQESVVLYQHFSKYLHCTVTKVTDFQESLWSAGSSGEAGEQIRMKG